MGLTTTAQAAPRYEGHRVVKVSAASNEAIAALRAAGAELLDERHSGGPVHLRVPPAADSQLAASGLSFEVVVADVQAQIDEERARLAGGGPVSHGAGFFDDFRDLTAIESHLDTLATDRPDLVQQVDVGTSLEGRTIRGIEIAHPDLPPDAPAVLLTGTMHAREWLATMTAICMADTLVHGEGTDPAITEALGVVSVIVIPVLNPDGYVYSWQDDRYWRKNRRDGTGVDLNRNFPVGWGGPGSSNDPQENDFHGAGPLSEPESAALVDFVVARPQLVAHLDYHTFGRLLLYPWGYTNDDAPDDALLSGLATTQAEAMAAVHGEDYIPLKGSDLYPAAGVVDDWAYGDVGLMAFVPELRPGFEGPGDFVVSPDQIGPTCQESLAGALTLLAWAGGLEPDPDPPDDTGGETTDGGTTDTGPSADSGSGSPPQDTGVGVTGSDDNDSGRPPDPDDAGDDDTAPPLGSDGTAADATGDSTAQDTTDDDGCACATSASAGDRAPARWGWALLLAGLNRRRRSGHRG